VTQQPVSPFFAYGTLELPEVMEAVTGRVFPARDAHLPGFARALLRDRSYPGIVERAGARTTGVLYDAVDRVAFALLDRFEDAFYERRRLDVEVGDGEPVSAHVYVIPPEHAGLLTSNPWQRARFATEHLTTYVAHCREFRQRAVRELALPPRPGGAAGYDDGTKS